MKIRYISDIHNEFFENGDYFLPEMKGEKQQILVLAGDISTNYSILKPYKNFQSFLGKKSLNREYYNENKEKSWLELLCERFRHVFFVAGNHDIYNQNLTNFYSRFRELSSHLTNFNILQNDTVVIDDKVFIGGTLWTDFDKGNPLTTWNFKRAMADHRKIREGNGYSKLDPATVLHQHINTRNYIFDQCGKYKDNDVVVITHHSPSFQTNVRNFSSTTTPLFHSELDYDILNHPNIKYWIYGHIHESHEHSLGECEMVCNCLGYRGHENIKNFDPFKTIDLP